MKNGKQLILSKSPVTERWYVVKADVVASDDGKSFYATQIGKAKTDVTEIINAIEMKAYRQGYEDGKKGE